MRIHTLFALSLSSVAMLAMLACGSVQDPVDAASDTIDAPTGAIDAPDVDANEVDAPMSSVDASVDGPGCVWVNIAMCDTGGTIAQFCPSGTHVNQLRRCDQTTYTPDQQYQQYHLCNYSQSCGCTGVVWSQVECCNN
jgi:hypothetical protein